MHLLQISHIKQLLAIGWLIISLAACSAVSNSAVATASIPLGTTLLAPQSTFSVYAVAWSPDGSRLALGGSDGNLQIRDARTGALLSVLQGHLDNVWSVAWSPDGTRLASASWDRTVQVWDTTTGRHLLTYDKHTDLVLAVAWSPDGSRLASASSDNTV